MGIFMTLISSSAAQTEKSKAALSSVLAAIVLTVFKIVVGISTGSLGILAEAAHSALDLMAALMTLFAVRLASKPADDQHHYGHGKVENLSALFETLLLLVTSAWIISEAVQRLLFKDARVDTTPWSFLVMIVSIAIDASRSRVLYAAARKYHSQALEADALHFRTDIWSSSVVIIGLLGVAIADRLPGLHILGQADSIAALGVAVIVVLVSVQLGIRTIHGLLDTVPPGKVETIIQAVEQLPGVVDIHAVRIRTSGADHFVDAHISVDGGSSVREIHALTEAIETVIGEILPNADVLVHPEPATAREDPGMTTRIKEAVEELPAVDDCHHIELHYFGSKVYVDAHITVDGTQSLSDAHSITEQIEDVICALLPGAEVNIHPEPIE
jgi:cation diffusion facilitator family transporter